MSEVAPAASEQPQAVGPAPESALVGQVPAPKQAPDEPVSPSSEPPTASTHDESAQDSPEPTAALAPDVDPLAVLSADLARVQQERDTIQANHDRMYQEVNALQRDLDAARAELAQERATRSVLPYQQQITDMRQQIAALEQENTRLRQAAPAQVELHLSDADHARIKDNFLSALAEHAVPEAAPEAETPASPFINRQ